MLNFYCYLCPKSFSTMLNVKKHLIYKHSVQEEGRKLTIKCVKSRDCPNIYRSFKAMANHVRRCSENNEIEVNDMEEFAEESVEIENIEYNNYITERQGMEGDEQILTGNSFF